MKNQIVSTAFILILSVLNSYAQHKLSAFERAQESYSRDSASTIVSEVNKTTGNIVTGVISPSFQSLLIDGAAQYIVEEFKEGVQTVYLNKLFEQLKNSEYLFIQKILPKSYHFLESITKRNLKSIGGDFKMVFEEDLRAMLINSVSYIENNRAEFPTFVDSKEFQALKVSVLLVDGMIRGYELSHLFDHVFNQIRGTGNFLEDPLCILNFYTKNYIISDAHTDALYRFPSKIELDILEPGSSAYTTFKITVKSDSLCSQSINTLMSKAQQIMPHLSAIRNALLSTGEPEVRILSVFEHTWRLLLEADAMSGALIKDNLERFTEKIFDFSKSTFSGDYGNTLTCGLDILENAFTSASRSDSLLILKQLSKTLSFIVDVAQAESADEIKSAIRNNATSFSFMDKRISRWNWTISSKPGILLGYEYNSSMVSWDNMKKVNTQDGRMTWGISAPIGVEFMWSSRPWLKCNKSEGIFSKVVDDSPKYHSHHSWSAFFGVVDLVAIFSYRFNSPEGELPEQISIQQVFSPCLGFSWSLPKSPMELGIRMQYTPDLRTIESNGIKEAQNALRLSLGLSWDIPLLKIASSD